ncbi:hypothetical protein DL96DRAFT_794672 [Flagelloscypha sp. PMI_526]|nr:hypothetical protein DL96DRAFT_794672 [Flagelloscypha sp. PMI_526]
MPVYHSTQNFAEREPLLSRNHHRGNPSSPPPYSELSRSPSSDFSSTRGSTDEPVSSNTTTTKAFPRAVILICLIFVLPVGAFLLGHVLGIERLDAERHYIARRTQQLNAQEDLLDQVNFTLIEDRRLWDVRRSEEERRLAEDRRLWNARRADQQKRLDISSAKLRDWETSLNRQAEQIRLDRQRWNDERDRREEEERQNKIERKKAGLRWIDLTPETKCLSFERRMYQAKLTHLPNHAPGNEWCWSVPIKIHGHVYNQPDWCGMKDGELYGQWYVDKNEPGCHTWFSILDNEEACVAGVSRTRRFFGKLENFDREDWDNWREMCATTPFAVRNFTFERPHQCGFRGLSWVGAWGSVDVQDDTCLE